jgi:predicted transposase/invertase (TIGR01784 family)
MGNYVEKTKEHQYNLRDFALFLSVMKNPKAYRNVLSIIMEEPDIQLQEVKVEQVVLNKSGKRAIRLDAWAKSTDLRQFNMEMQNEIHEDDLRKRSRFYQGLMDTPILKSGKDTKYRMLPSTVIIFITLEDIFGRDLAKYTFSEKCEEVEDLKLDDGTAKIFINMTSKNGSPELVSMLQYMKETRIDNPEIVVKDSRLIELDEIVNEVKESEEWEAVQMNIFEIGAYAKLKSQVEKKLAKGYLLEEIADMLEEEVQTIKEIIDEINSSVN